jgi:hypothetical protein
VIAHDDVTLGSDDAGEGSIDVPEPAVILLMSLGLGLLERNRIRQK